MALRFKGNWRAYQKRVLDSLSLHLQDEKLHIVAAPGAGKTTLGIEVLARLNQPALILCPTNTIKNQWSERICSSFLCEKEYGCVSTNIKEPRHITVTTYQALLAAFTGALDADAEQDGDVCGRFNQTKADKLIDLMKKAGVSVLCFDEAHHLRKEWWKALTYLTDELMPRQTVALTATPPYDVDYQEWERYEELCGPIDEAISIPELVKNNDLCPHQDFVYFSSLRENEKTLVNNLNDKVTEFLKIIKNDTALISYLQNMPIWTVTDADVEKILDNSDFYVSIASLLKSSGIKISKKFLKLFGASESSLPPFNLKQAKEFLNGFLITCPEEFPGLEAKIEGYLNLAKRSGLIQKKRIVLNDSPKIQKQVANSLGKLDSIVDIVEAENRSLNSSLRMVILADYIKADDVDNSSLGVVPIWRVLKGKYGSKIPIGILSGSLIVLPLSVRDEFLDLLGQNSLEQDCVSISLYDEDNNYIRITPKESAKHCIVSLITEMFSKGFVNILVGTQALLGEGWDAPCINSLILSSTVSSYMLSNQMRGRAIRKDKNNPDKISNIWHLATISAPKNSVSQFFNFSEETEYTGLYDLEQLTKRFEGFEAPSYYDKHEIMNGIDRVISNNFYYELLNGERGLSVHNSKILELAHNRQQTKKWWQDSLYLGYGNGIMNLSRGVSAPCPTSKSLCYKGYRYLLGSVLSIFMIIVAYMCKLNLVRYIVYLIPILLVVLCSVGIKYLRTGSVAGVMKQVAITHLEALHGLGLIKTSLKNVGITVTTGNFVYVVCKNLSIEENNLLMKCLQEFLDPINNPRYIMIRRGEIPGQVDYFAIPSVMSARKSDVEVFEKLWDKHVGNGEIVYTRNFEGRKLLLKARNNAFSAIKRGKTAKLSKWQ